MPKNKGRWRYYVVIARPDHWVKHIFILPGTLVALALAPRYLASGTIVANCVEGFASACLIASANYVINEWLDAESDKNHPEKMNRPAAAGVLHADLVYFEYIMLAIFGIVLASQVNRVFLIATLAFFFSGITYNVKPFRTKDCVYLDVISEALNNPIRLILGWSMVTPKSIPPLSLLAAYWAGGAFLMAAKRLSEYSFIVEKKGRSGPGLYRRSLVFYSVESLTISCFVYALTSCFGLAVFLVKYRAEFVFIFPLIIILLAIICISQCNRYRLRKNQRQCIATGG